MLTKTEIWQELSRGTDGDGLVITPIFCDEQIGAGSVDVHLGHEFILFKRASAAQFDINDDHSPLENLHRYQEKTRIGTGHKFILHPHQLVLGATIEFISLPCTLGARVSGRSTWGRTGLVIATATEIAPGFKGCVTLERDIVKSCG